MRNTSIALALTVLGIVSGLWAAFCSMGMGGDGSGWLSPVKVCWVGIFAGPAAGIAWGLRGRIAGVVLAFLLLAVLLVADFILMQLTRAEGVGYAFKLARLDPGFMLLWSMAWFGWQLLVLWTVVDAAKKWFRKE